MDKSLLEVFSEVKNALIVGAVWTSAAYLVLGTLWTWWVHPMSNANAAARAVVSALGDAGLTVAAFLLMALAGEAIIRVSTTFWSFAHRLSLRYILKNVSDVDSAKSAVRELTWFAMLTRTYTNRALIRLIDTYVSQLSAQNLGPATSKGVHTLADRVISMAPALLDSSDIRFVHQQRVSARFELSASLAGGVPLLVVALTASLTNGHMAFLLGCGVALLSMTYCLLEAHRSWMHSNSRTAHALVEQKYPLFEIAHNWDASRSLQRNLHPRLNSLFRRPSPGALRSSE